MCLVSTCCFLRCTHEDTHTYERQRRRAVNGSLFDIIFHAVNVRYYGMKFVPRIFEKLQMIHAIIVFGQKIDKIAEHLLN